MNDNNIDEEIILNLWFSNIDGIGAKTRKLLRRHFGSIERVYSASETLLREVLSDEKVRTLVESRNIGHIKELKGKLDERKINIVYPGSNDYPNKLLEIHDYPDVLYVKGILKDSLNLYNKNIGIVGSRNPDTYGREMALLFGKRLSGQGINIISGLARGVDSMAHRGALAVGGYTLAVLGCGINVTYPRENAELYSNIERSGAIISEYGLDVPPNAGQFPCRNRIISGLSDGVMVIEARSKSGSLITADLALEQGKQVYALPGRAYDVNSEGSNNLIKMGAMCVTSFEEILIDLNGGEGYLDNIDVNKDIEGLIKMSDKNCLAPVEKIVYSCLSLEPMYIDDIIGRAGIDITKAISTLYVLEEKGIIKQPLKGYYIVAI